MGLKCSGVSRWTKLITKWQISLFGAFEIYLKILFLCSPDPLFGPRRGRAVTRQMVVTWLDLEGLVIQ